MHLYRPPIICLKSNATRQVFYMIDLAATRKLLDHLIGFSQDFRSDPLWWHLFLALYPGSSQFFNVAHRKTREPGKIYHVHDVG